MLLGRDLTGIILAKAIAGLFCSPSIVIAVERSLEEARRCRKREVATRLRDDLGPIGCGLHAAHNARSNAAITAAWPC